MMQKRFLDFLDRLAIRKSDFLKRKHLIFPTILLIKSKAIILNVNVVWFWELVLRRGENWRELEILIGFCRFSDKADELDKANGAVSLSENHCELLLNLVVLRVRAARTGKANIQKGVVPKSSICVSVCLHTQLLLVFLHKLLLQKLGLL